eukprot:COSAG01_NODE_7760_length_3068_cov_1.624789_4_plen_81_part_00
MRAGSTPVLLRRRTAHSRVVEWHVHGTVPAETLPTLPAVFNDCCLCVAPGRDGSGKLDERLRMAVEGETPPELLRKKSWW